MEDFSRRTLIKQGLLAATTVALAPALRASSATTLPLEEYRQWDALDIAERVRQGDVSAAEVL
ncbi:MAG TPA: amidase, partial [Haliea salexigens]|nr:amidase [Haliea salexigens]